MDSIDISTPERCKNPKKNAQNGAIGVIGT
jgi:hypothetical protein